MTWYRCGVKSKTLKDIFHDKVFDNSGYTTYTITAYGSPARCTVNEGQVAIDTTIKTVYVYIDATIIGENKTVNDWWTVAYLGGIGFAYMPRGLYSGTSRERLQDLITDVSSPAYKPLMAANHDSTQGLVLMSPYGYGLTVGDRYICYGSWQYL